MDFNKASSTTSTGESMCRFGYYCGVQFCPTPFCGFEVSVQVPRVGTIKFKEIKEQSVAIDSIIQE